MNVFRHGSMKLPLKAQQQLCAMRPTYGRTAVYRRIQQLQTSKLHSSSSCLLSPSRYQQAHLRSRFLPDSVQSQLGALSVRSFHQARIPAQKAEPKEELHQKETAYQDSAKEADSEQPEDRSGEEKAKDDKEGGKDKEEGKKEESPAPPPPHGDKSPWQVFRETLSSEFKASKEWNESTKALAAGAQQFTENESVKKARQAYDATTGKVTSGTAKVLKSTAGAVGKGAAWTWETPVVKGVRTTVNATADVIDKTTKPIRETEAFKNVKNVIDDGSSSRYGGWVEKEERRKARELRDLQEARERGGLGKRAEVAKEDPK